MTVRPEVELGAVAGTYLFSRKGKAGLRKKQRKNPRPPRVRMWGRGKYFAEIYGQPVF